MLVRELMSTDVVTVAESATLRTAVQRLLDNDVGSVIVRSAEGHPTGMLTETDVLRASYRTGEPLAELDVADFRHRPVFTTEPSATIRHVATQMADEDVKKAPVMDDLDLVGIVTMTDIVWHLADLRKEASELGEAYSRWKPR